MELSVSSGQSPGSSPQRMSLADSPSLSEIIMIFRMQYFIVLSVCSIEFYNFEILCVRIHLEFCIGLRDSETFFSI